MPTGSDRDEFPEPAVGIPEAGGTAAGPPTQRGPQKRPLQSLVDAAGELARAMGPDHGARTNGKRSSWQPAGPLTTLT